MSLKERQLTSWLKENHPELSWKRTGGDEPPRKLDSHYLNRSEGYEIKDIIINYYERCNISYNENNFEITYEKIMGYKSEKKVTREEMIKYLVSNNSKCK